MTGSTGLAARLSHRRRHLRRSCPLQRCWLCSAFPLLRESPGMPAARRVRTPPTDDWVVLQLRLHWPEQVEYELIRPVVVFGRTPAERAEQTGAATRTI